MFTGLIEDVGIIESLERTSDGSNFWIRCNLKNNDLKIGDSITVNGACQTVTDLKDSNKLFKIYSSFKTLELTNLSKLSIGNRVNLERALLPSQRMGGHIVQGHVDGYGKVVSREERDSGNTFIFKINVPLNLCNYIVERGSITIDGISLTVVSIDNNLLELILIPETLKKTNADDWIVGSIVNIETDIMARYLEKMMGKVN